MNHTFIISFDLHNQPTSVKCFWVKSLIYAFIQCSVIVNSIGFQNQLTAKLIGFYWVFVNFDWVINQKYSWSSDLKKKQFWVLVLFLAKSFYPLSLQYSPVNQMTWKLKATFACQCFSPYKSFLLLNKPLSTKFVNILTKIVTTKITKKSITVSTNSFFSSEMTKKYCFSWSVGDP